MLAVPAIGYALWTYASQLGGPVSEPRDSKSQRARKRAAQIEAEIEDLAGELGLEQARSVVCRAWRVRPQYLLDRVAGQEELGAELEDTRPGPEEAVALASDERRIGAALDAELTPAEAELCRAVLGGATLFAAAQAQRMGSERAPCLRARPLSSRHGPATVARAPRKSPDQAAGKRPRKAPLERDIQADIKAAMAARGARLEKQPAGMARSLSGDHLIRLGEPGRADLIGVVPIRVRPEHVGRIVGLAIAVEVKHHGEEPRFEQELWLRAWRAAGGVGIVASSPEAAVALTLAAIRALGEQEEDADPTSNA